MGYPRTDWEYAPHDERPEETDRSGNVSDINEDGIAIWVMVAVVMFALFAVAWPLIR